MPHLLFDRIDEPGLNTLSVYEKRGGYSALRKALEMPPAAIIEEIKQSAIRGRGGAGFQMGMKASFLPKGDMAKYLVCNADESEPGTFKDRELMQKSPHTLIEGMIITTFATGIHHAFIYIRGEYQLQADILDAAVAEAEAAGYIGENILGSGHSLKLVVHRGAGAYICGEETGLLDSLEGKRGNPRLKPPFPAIEGLYHGPTLVNNVETLGTVPAIINMGGAEYAKIGTESSTGTKLISVSGDVQRPGNYEIELGTSSRDIIYGLCGGPKEGRKVKMWFPGGSSSPVLLESDLDLPYDFDTLAKAGSMLGSGAIIVVDDTHSAFEVAQKVVKFYAHESCGKCVPCREGTNWTHKFLARIESGEATPMDLDILASVQTQIIGNCLCVLGDAMAMPIGSIVAKFREELEAEIETARERANSLTVCHGLSRRSSTSRSTAARSRPSRARCWSTPPSRATSRSRTSVTSRSSASRSAPAACAWSRSRASPSCRPRARRRCATAWSSTRRSSGSRTRRTRSSSSCSSTTRSTARSATRAASARCRTTPSAGAKAAAA